MKSEFSGKEAGDDEFFNWIGWLYNLHWNFNNEEFPWKFLWKEQKAVKGHCGCYCSFTLNILRNIQEGKEMHDSGWIKPMDY